MVTKASIQRLYNRYKRWSGWHLRRGKTETGTAFLHLAAYVGYKFNLHYTDEDIEDRIEGLSHHLTPEPILINALPTKVVFYDSFAMDNRGLTQQYLRALLELGYDVLYLVPHGSIGPDIRTYLEQVPRATITCLTHKSFTENLTEGLAAIKTAQPAFVFQHMGPDDILGCCLNLPLKGCLRYRINLTDHAFWVGKRCSDYVLEFRRYGGWLSHHHRRIPLNKLLLQPYYPVVIEKSFEGFPDKVNTSNILLFAGATYYKIYGNNHRFLHLIRQVLEAHPHAQFLLAGDGNDAPLLAFIRKYHLEDRIVLLGSRRDITQVFRHIDIYINTYPMIGGLMSQLAAVCHKPVIGYTDEALYSFNDVEDLMGLSSNGLLVTASETIFLERVHQLITDASYRDQLADLAQSNLPTPETFKVGLAHLMETHQPLTIKQFTGIRVDLNAVTNVYLDVENRYLLEHRFFARIKPLKILINGWLRHDFYRKVKKTPI